jgi:hypothetical protein
MHANSKCAVYERWRIDLGDSQNVFVTKPIEDDGAHG